MSDVAWTMAENAEFGPFVLKKKLGMGGMAFVWLAHRAGEEAVSPVVLKTMLPGLSGDPKFVAMFLQEAALGAELSHPNLVEVIDVGKIGPHFYIEMEYWPGLTIRHVARVVASRPRLLALPVVLSTMIDVCLALSYVHNYEDVQGQRLNLVHRDVSPENIIIGLDGVSKLLDFGIASTVRSKLTEVGERKGKLHYMPPEAFTSARGDYSWDIYAVGAVLYELMTGRRPYHAESEAELIARITQSTIPPPSAFRDDIPADLERIIVTALAREPSARVSDAAALGRALHDILWRLDRRNRHEIAAEGVRRIQALGVPKDEGLEPTFSIDVSLGSDRVEAEVLRFPSTRSRAARATQNSAPGPVSTTEAALRSVSPTDVGQREGLQENALTHFVRGLDHHRRGDVRSALAAWELASSLDPRNTTIAVNVRMLRRKMESKE